MSHVLGSIQRLRGDWDTLAQHDALWAVLSEPQMRGGRWDVEAFF
jgi:hypothetical protein